MTSKMSKLKRQNVCECVCVCVSQKVMPHKARRQPRRNASVLKEGVLRSKTNFAKVDKSDQKPRVEVHL